MKYQITKHKTLADTITPIIAYLRIREVFAKSILFECADYQDIKNSNSILVFDEIASLSIEDNQIITRINEEFESIELQHQSYTEMLEGFMNSISLTEEQKKDDDLGIYGFTSYNCVSQMDEVVFEKMNDNLDLPKLHYGFFRFTIVFHHHSNTLTIIECKETGETSKLEYIESLLNKTQTSTYSFESLGEESYNITDDEFLENVIKAKEHCQNGNTFQMVLSRQFNQKFIGDDFNVYRSLRSLNPSPYLFYADFGNFKLMGSSPEAQLIIKNDIAEIHPIAGTFKRTGDTEHDLQETKRLQADEKENSEHVMLVDLARNDLSRHCNNVKIEKYKEIQTFSHVIHLVSLVKGEKIASHKALDIFSHTFPAGTLSGAPKIKAMNLINQLEPSNRSFYGGAIGSFSFNGNINHAIIIRSLCSKDNTLYYQAGAGVVINSQPENELMEVSNKLGALRKAIIQAEQIHQKSFAL